MADGKSHTAGLQGEFKEIDPGPKITLKAELHKLAALRYNVADTDDLTDEMITETANHVRGCRTCLGMEHHETLTQDEVILRLIKTFKRPKNWKPPVADEPAAEPEKDGGK